MSTLSARRLPAACSLGVDTVNALVPRDGHPVHKKSSVCSTYVAALGRRCKRAAAGRQAAARERGMEEEVKIVGGRGEGEHALAAARPQANTNHTRVR